MGFFDRFKKEDEPGGGLNAPAGPGNDLYEIPPQAQSGPPGAPGGAASYEAGAPAAPALDEELPPPPVPQAPPADQPLDVGLGPDYVMDDLFRAMVRLDASDIHLAVGNPPMFRIRGDIHRSNLPELTQQQAEAMLLPLIDSEHRDTFEATGNVDFAHEVPGVARYRGNFLLQHNGMGAVFRTIPSKIPTVEQLNLPPVLKTIAESRRGLVIVTGPTGSGKSTTLAAMINHINETRPAHIITIEDPVEFTHTSKRCLIDHREVGAHATSFADALRAALREDPDIVLVGEMRDLETIALAITAAETGVLVFGTLHTNSAVKTVDRIIDVFPAKQQEQIRSMLAESLRSVVAQQLLKTADGKGRCASIEVLIATFGLGSMIREGKTNLIATVIQTGKELGMQTMEMDLIRLVKEGKVTPRDAYEKAIDKSAMTRAGITEE